jgi:hypothetical protein
MSLLRSWMAFGSVPLRQACRRVQLVRFMLLDYVCPNVLYYYTGPPTQKKAFEALIQDEKIAELAGMDAAGSVQLINMALRIEQQQLVTSCCSFHVEAHGLYRAVVKQKVGSKEATDKELLDARLKLRRDLNKWRRTQLDLYPKLAMEDNIVNAAEPECDKLLLPSDFNEPQRRSLGLGKLAEVEYALREGQAYDALDKLRLAIQTFNHNLKFKVDQVRGQGANTRAQAFLRTLSSNKISAADKYRTARAALLVLGLPPEDPSLQPLHDTQLWCKNESAAPAQGDTRREDPWYWMVGRPSGLSPEEEIGWRVECMYLFHCNFLRSNIP